jgi:hypothetical protein
VGSFCFTVKVGSFCFTSKWYITQAHSLS